MANLSHFILHADGFEYRGDFISDNDIKHLSIQHWETHYRTNFIHDGTTNEVELVIELTSKKKIKIKSKSGFAPTAFYLWDRPNDRLAIDQAYKALASRTFNNRIAPYILSMDTHGFFEYGECTFYKSGDVLLNGNRFPLDSVSLTKNSFYIFFEKKNPGFIDKLSKGWSGSPHVSLSYDQDVFFALLNHYYNVRW